MIPLSAKLTLFDFQMYKAMRKSKYYELAGFSDQEMEEIRPELSAYLKEEFLNRGSPIEDFKYRGTLCAFLVHIGAKTYEEGNFWSSIFQALDIQTPSVALEQKIGELFLKTCRDGLGFYFPHTGFRFVVAILAHSFVPDSYIPKWARYIRWAFPEIESDRPVSDEKIAEELRKIKESYQPEVIAGREKTAQLRKSLEKSLAYWPLIMLYREAPEATSYYTEFLDNPMMMRVIEEELPNRWAEKARELSRYQLKKELVVFLADSPFVEEDRHRTRLVRLKDTYQRAIDRYVVLKEAVSRINRVRNLLSPGKPISLDDLRAKLEVVREWKEEHAGPLSWDVVKALYHFIKNHYPDALNLSETALFDFADSLFTDQEIPAEPPFGDSAEPPFGESGDATRNRFLCEGTRCFLSQSGNDAHIFIRSTIEYIRALEGLDKALLDEADRWPLLSKRLRKGIRSEIEHRTHIVQTPRQSAPYLELDLDLERLWLVIPPIVLNEIDEQEKIFLSVVEAKTNREVFVRECSLFDQGGLIETQRERYEISPFFGTLEIRALKENRLMNRKEPIREFSIKPQLCEEYPLLVFDENGEALKKREYATDYLYLILSGENEITPAEAVSDRTRWYGVPNFDYAALDLSDTDCFQIRSPTGGSLAFYRAGFYGKLSESPVEGVTARGENVYFRCPTIRMPPASGPSRVSTFQVASNPAESDSPSESMEVCPAELFDSPYGRYRISIFGVKRLPIDMVFWVLPRFRFRWSSEDRSLYAPGRLEIKAEDDIHFSFPALDPSDIQTEEGGREIRCRIGPGVQTVQAVLTLNPSGSDGLTFSCEFERPFVDEDTSESLSEYSPIFYGYPLKKEFRLPYDLRGKQFECRHDQTGQITRCSVKKDRLSVDMRPFFDNIRASETAEQSFSIYERGLRYAETPPIATFSFRVPFADAEVALQEDADAQVTHVHCRWSREDNPSGLRLRLSTEGDKHFEAFLDAGQGEYSFKVQTRAFPSGPFTVEWVVGSRIAREFRGLYEPDVSLAFTKDDIFAKDAGLEILKVTDEQDREYALAGPKCVIRNIRPTDKIEEGEPYEGDIVWLDDKGYRKYWLNTNPVRFFINEDHQTLPFLIDKEGDGAYYDVDEKLLYWIEKHRREDILVERVYFAFRRLTRAD